MARRPFFSGNYQLGSNANAANLIAQAGAAQGKMFQNLGSDIGGAIEKYGLNKEKRAKLTDKIENRIKLDPSIVQRLTMSGDEDYDKKNLKLIEQLSTGELGLRRLETLDSAMATIKEIDLQNEKTEDRVLKTQLQQAIISEKENANVLFNETKDLKKRNLELEQDSKRINNLMDRVEVTKAYKIFPEAIKTELAELKERLNVTRDKDQTRKYYTPGEQARNKKALDKIGIDSAEESLDEQTQKNIANEARSLVYSPTEQAQDEKEQAGADLLATQNKSKLIPMRDIDGNIIANQFTLNNVPYTKSADGELSRIGTRSENIGLPRTDKAENLIKMGQDAAKNYDVKKKSLDAPVAAGGDIGGMFEDALLYLGGKVGLSGEQMDEGVGLGLEAREVQSARLSAINAQIKPTLVNAVNSRGPVYTQKQIDEEILANPKQDNPTVIRRLREYPTLLNKSLTEAETVVRDPEIKPGSDTYEKARSIVLNTPLLLKQINAAIGGQVNTGFSDPSIERILGNNKKPNDLPIVPSNRSKLTQEDLLKML